MEKNSNREEESGRFNVSIFMWFSYQVRKRIIIWASFVLGLLFERKLYGFIQSWLCSPSPHTYTLSILNLSIFELCPKILREQLLAWVMGYFMWVFEFVDCWLFAFFAPSPLNCRSTKANEMLTKLFWNFFIGRVTILSGMSCLLEEVEEGEEENWNWG